MTRKLAVVVNGGRNYGKIQRERAAIYAALDKAKPEVVLHGAATGADTIAGEWCKLRGVWVVEYPADWTLGKIAGPKRNAQMIDDLLLYKPDGYRIGVISFPGGVGTASCNTLAERRGIKIWQPQAHAAQDGGAVKFVSLSAMTEQTSLEGMLTA